MEQTKNVFFLTLLKVYLTGMYFGHGLPPAQQGKRPSFKEARKYR
jgi:hypothetical protein